MVRRDCDEAASPRVVVLLLDSHPVVVSVRRVRVVPAVVRVRTQRTDCRDGAAEEERTADRDWNQIRVEAVELRHSRVEESVFGRTFEPQRGHY